MCPYNILLLFADIVRLKKVSTLSFSRHDAKRSSRRACRCLYVSQHIRELTNRHGFCSLCGRWPSLTIPLNDTCLCQRHLRSTLQYPCILFRDAVGWTDTKVRDMNRIIHCAQKSLWCLRNKFKPCDVCSFLAMYYTTFERFLAVTLSFVLIKWTLTVHGPTPQAPLYI